MTEIGPACEPWGPDGWLQPASAWTSLAFAVAGVAIIAVALRRRRRRPTSDRGLAANTTALWVILGVLAIGNGIGSVIQHGPEPSWNPVVHDPPLMGALALLAADGVADLAGRRFRHWWWVVPTVVCVVLAAVWPVGSMVVQIVVAVVAVGVTLLRWWLRVPVRRPVGWALVLLGVGGIVGSLSRPGAPWCAPGGWWYETGMSGHAVWHVLAAAGLFVIAPALGFRGAEADR